MPDKTTPDLNFSPKGLYIGGEWQESIDSGTFETINPSNLDKLGDVSRYRGPDTRKPKNQVIGWPQGVSRPMVVSFL